MVGEEEAYVNNHTFSQIHISYSFCTLGTQLIHKTLKVQCLGERIVYTITQFYPDYENVGL